MASIADGFWNTDVNDIDDAFFGTTISIRRQDDVQAGVVAIVEMMDNEVLDQSTGLRTIVQSRDYIIHKSAYQIVDCVTGPLRGDQFEEVLGSETRLFEVVPIADLPPYADEDADGIRWRIKTREVKS